MIDILLINIHGLVRQERIEFGRDADTGGQTRYVIDLLKHLSEHPQVRKVDMITRRIKDKRVSSDYAQDVEQVGPKARIIRLSCGGNKYLPKEKLWPYLDEFTDRVIEFINRQEDGYHLVHGHYADAGYVAASVASVYGIPLIYTAHSLGRNKLSFLEGAGYSVSEAEQKYRLLTRIQAEEQILYQADLVIASTGYEKEELYGLYGNRAKPEYSIIPPGLELEKFFPYYEYEMPDGSIDELQRQAHHRMARELRRFHYESDKPMIITLCRPDGRKNIDKLIDVYGKDKQLQAMANLAVFAGIRDSIATMPDNEREVLTDMLMKMDQYDLYGKMAIPKNHDPEMDVPELYRIAALKRGVFISTSYLETFGLTFIEASACGLPFVATREGGPADIVKNCESGTLVDIADEKQITDALKQILTDRELWDRLSSNGINGTRANYSWEQHCETYVSRLQKLLEGRQATRWEEPGQGATPFGRRMKELSYLLVADIDDTLTGDEKALSELAQVLKDNRGSIGFAVATGREVSSARKLLEQAGLEHVDIIISSVGSEIYYGDELIPDKGWETHIRKNWKPQQVLSSLEGLADLTLQEEPGAVRAYKKSYDITSGRSPADIEADVHDILYQHRLSCRVIRSHGSFIDILPYRAGKGKAVRYLSAKWNIPYERIITAGNSGNDLDMLTAAVKSVVVANHTEELKRLRRSKRTYFSPKSYAAGVLDGLYHYKVINPV